VGPVGVLFVMFRGEMLLEMDDDRYCKTFPTLSHRSLVADSLNVPGEVETGNCQ
jgi:hypothetical protein